MRVLFLNFDIDEFNKLDKANRDLISKKEVLEQEKKSLSKSKEKYVKYKDMDITHLIRVMLNSSDDVVNHIYWKIIDWEKFLLN